MCVRVSYVEFWRSHVWNNMIIRLIWCHPVSQLWSCWKENNTSVFVFPQRELPVLSDGSRRLEEHHPTQPVLQQQLPQNLQPAVQRRQEEVVFLAPDSGRPAATEGRDSHADGRDLQTAGEEHGTPRWAWGNIHLSASQNTGAITATDHTPSCYWSWFKRIGYCYNLSCLNLGLGGRNYNYCTKLKTFFLFQM